jgi:hypothetical protein
MSGAHKSSSLAAPCAKKAEIINCMKEPALAAISPIQVILTIVGNARRATNLGVGVEEYGKTVIRRMRRVRSTTHVERV